MRDVETPSEPALWIAGVLTALLSVIGLVMAARADDGGFELAGGLLFLFGVLANFVLIAMATGKNKPE